MRSRVLGECCDQLVLEGLVVDEAADLDALVPLPPSPWIPEDVTHWGVRWCPAHIAAEVARHAGARGPSPGDAGRGGSFELNDAADGEA